MADRVDNLFQNLAGVVGDYKQATVLLAETPAADATDMKLANPDATLSVKQADKDTFVLHTFEKTKGQAAAISVVIKRNGADIQLAWHDLLKPANSFTTSKATVADSAGLQLAFYLSDVTYTDTSAAGIAGRAAEQVQRQSSYETLIDLLALTGLRVPKEIAASDDHMKLLFVARGAQNPVVFTEVLLDPLGKSVRTPKGTLSLTVMQVFSK